MRIVFSKIEIHHFMAFEDEVFDFSQCNGMNLVCGKNFDIQNSKNGAGKSTVFLALLYGLYGQFPNKIKSEFIANRNLKDKEVRLIVHLSIDGTHYKTVTCLGKRGQSTFQLFQVNGDEEIDQTKSSIAETRKFFEDEVMHCDMSLFLRTILLTSEQNYNFFNLKKQDKKDFISKIFDIGVFSQMYDRIHKDLLASNKSLVSHQNQLLVLNENCATYDKKSRDFMLQTENEMQQLQAKVHKSQEELKKLLESKVNCNEALVKKCEDAIEALNSRVQKSSLDKNGRRSAMLSIKKDIEHISHQRDSLLSQISKHQKLLDRLCDDCKKKFLEYNNLSQYSDDVKKAEAVISQKQSQYAEEEAYCKKADDDIIVAQDKIQKLKSKISELTHDYNLAKQRQDEKQRALDLQMFSLNQLQAKKNPYLDLIEKNDQSIKSEIELLQKTQKASNYLRKAEEIVSQDSLKKFIIKDLIGLINNRIKHYLSKMGSKYTCIFDENLDYRFMTESGECELYNFSCGEKKRIEIATCFSFRDFIAQRSNISSNILVIDEYIDSGIDSLAVDSILEILKNFSKAENQNIFVISHRSEISENMFDRTIEVQKRDGISKVVFQ